MSAYTYFAVIGSSGLAAMIASELARQPHATVTVLSRSGSQKPEGVSEAKVVDYDKPEELKEALKGVQVVVSVVGAAAFATNVQYQIADAAKAAGVQLFLPSEFGMPTHDLPSTDAFLYPIKTKVQEYLKEIELDYLLIYNGAFPSDIYNPFWGFDFENGKVNIVGDGNMPVSHTTRADVAHVTARILTTQALESLANRHLEIRGDVVSLNQAVELWRKTHGNAPVEVTYKSVEEAQEQMKSPGMEAFVAYLRVNWAKGRAASEDDTANKLFPDWQPTKLEDFFATV
ncbi:hypothetical protein ACM66B_001685 [Microbotryomycetes sp. NB124-2]